MKKLASGLIIGLMLVGSGIVAHADPTDVDKSENIAESAVEETIVEDEKASIELIKPQPDYMVTTNSTAVVSGKGKEGTSVVLEVYGQEENISIEIQDEDEKALNEDSSKDKDDEELESKESKEQPESDDEDEKEEKDKESDEKSDKESDKKSKSKKFTKLLKKENFEIGSMGLFVKEIKLNVGENKIILRSKSDGVKFERIVKYKKIEEEEVKKSIDKIQEKGMTQLINDICSQK